MRVGISSNPSIDSYCIETTLLLVFRTVSFVKSLGLSQLAFCPECRTTDLLHRVQHDHWRGWLGRIPYLCRDATRCQHGQSTVICAQLALIRICVLYTTTSDPHELLRLLLIQSYELLIISLVPCNC